MLSLHAVGPVSALRRRRCAALLENPASAGGPDLEEIKGRLRDLRNETVANLGPLVEELVDSLAACPGAEVTLARDASEAVKAVQGISGDGPVAVNKSAVVTRELLPALEAAGSTVIETYYDELRPFESRFIRSWQLPAVGVKPLFRAVGLSSDLGARRRESLRRDGSRNFTGLVGASAVSAREGAVLLLQHGRNVSRIVCEARKVILVVSLEKIVRDLEDALFQTRCMALFGLEALLLGLHGRQEGNASCLDMLPLDKGGGGRGGPIHLILLDNGRSELAGGRYRDLLSCIGCRACVKGCSGSQFSEWLEHWSPREYALFLALNRAPLDSFCLQCKSCQACCPLGIDLPGMIIQARADLRAGTGPSMGDRLLGRLGRLERWGSLAPAVANALAASGPVRWLAEKVLDFSRERRLPRLRGPSLEKRFRSGKPDP